MYVVVVTFEVKPDTADAFRTAVLAQARNSLDREPGCQVFDVAQPENAETTFYLYEIYDDAGAFQDHLKARHFLDFDAQVQPMTLSKHVETYTLLTGRN